MDAPNQYIANNAIVGDNPTSTLFSISSYTNYSSSDYNAFALNAKATNNFQWNTPPYDVGMDWVNPEVTRSFNSLASMTEGTGQESHSILITYADFGRLSATDKTNIQRLYAPEDYDFTPSSRANLIDAGVVLPTINDGFVGKAPDIGAIEFGGKAPTYGPRTPVPGAPWGDQTIRSLPVRLPDRQRRLVGRRGRLALRVDPQTNHPLPALHQSSTTSRYMMKIRVLAAVATLIAASFGPAHAALTVFSSQANFLAQLSNAGVDTFDNLARTLVADPLARTAGTFSYTASAGPNSDFFPGGAGSDVWLASDNRFDTIQFSNFTSTVRGVGGLFFGTNESGLFTNTPANLTVTATDTSGSFAQVLVNPTTTTFLGFVSTSSLISLTVWVGSQGVGTSGVWPTVNNLTLGTVAAVPEPETVALLLAGLAFTGVIARRRRQR